MASINKLSIRGVRSFSPDDAEQVLEFYFPCTIIVGANGCGKTTIIESLKFAVCGALPPGNRSGQAFVHDPRSIGLASVKANVKLRFTNRAGSSMVVVRSMEVQQKKTTMSFKQLDGVLRTVDSDGNRLSLSHKCSELDRQIPMLLGVSKPILEHVVFCHQEDSSWPLQEGAVLKKRFDEIFDSTRYSKALEIFAKKKKEYQATAKDIKADLAGLASHKHAAMGFENEIKAYNDQIEDVEEEIAQAAHDLKEVRDEQDRLEKIMVQIRESKSKIDARKNEWAQEEAVVQKQREMLHEDLTTKHNTRELKEMLRNFDNDVENRVGRLEELRDDVKHRQEDIANLRQKETDLQSSMGRLMAEREAHELRLLRRYEKMKHIGQTYSLGDVLSQVGNTQSQHVNSSYLLSTTNDASLLGSSMAHLDIPPSPQDLEISTEDMEEFYRALKKKEAELGEALADHKARRQQEEDQLQSVLSDLIAKQKSIDNDRAKLNKEQTDARKELQQISTTFTSASRVRQSDVEEARLKATKLAKERDQLFNDERRSTIPTKIRSLEEKIDRLKREIDDDQLVLKDLRLNADLQSSVEVLKAQCLNDSKALREMVLDHRPILQEHGISIPTDLPDDSNDDGCNELTNTIERIFGEASVKFDSFSMDLMTATDEVTRCQRIVSERSALIDRDRGALLSKKSFMARHDDDRGIIKQVCQVLEQLKQHEGPLGIFPPDTLKETTPQELHAYLTSRLADVEAESTDGITQDTARRLLTKLRNLSTTSGGGRECPCCARTMDNEEFRTFSKQIAFLTGVQSPLLKLDERDKAARIRYREWRQLVDENMNVLLEYRHAASESKDLERSLSEMENSFAVDTVELEQAKERHMKLGAKVEGLRNLRDATKRWSDFASRIAEKRIDISSKQLDLSLGNPGSTRTAREVENELNQKMEEKENYSDQIHKMNKEMGKLNERIAAMTSTATSLDRLAREKEAKLAKDQEMTTRKTFLSERISQCALEEKKLQEEIAPVKQKIRTKETEKQRMRNLANEEEKKLSDNVNQFAADVTSLREIISEIDEYLRSTKKNNLDLISEQAKGIADKIAEKKAEIEKLQPSLDKLTKAAEDQERHKKNLQENINLIQSVHRMEELKRDIQKLEEDSGIVEGSETCEEDYRQEAKRKEKLVATKARLEGRRSEIVEKIRSLKRKLSSPEYKNVTEEHRVASIKYETTQMAVRDIDKYYWALDQALLRFHSLKITEINTIIRDLWYLTYRGEDITNIEIVSGQDSSSRATRSYNYRVVMTKGGGTRLDMRGRCSAGQRVLASIVIRLALAETFCVNCGCIALDEPTVNLDHHNKRGLAIALAQIVASRSKQGNFQLIVITHDEDFVVMMKTELSSQTGFSMPEKYFCVRREEGSDGKYYSKIDAIDWDELI